ncbi:MAG: hypothetical protein ACTSPT_02900 [Candidatus Heimdallarchaeota archaeon]
MAKNESSQQIISKDMIIPNEIAELVNSMEFLDFVRSIDEIVDDGMTFSELLSSKTILGKALELIEKYHLEDESEK